MSENSSLYKWQYCIIGKDPRKGFILKAIYVSFAFYDFVYLILYCLFEVDEWYPGTKHIQFEIWASISNTKML